MKTIVILGLLMLGCGTPGDEFPPCVQTPNAVTECGTGGICAHIGGGPTFCTHECSTDADCAAGRCTPAEDASGVSICTP
jgi:hypothetical protein